MNKHIIYFFSLLAFNLCASEEYEIIELQLNQGILAGKLDKTFLKHKGYFTFNGIPFAEPPLGELRFQPPVPHRGWKGVYEAYNKKQTCIQFNSRLRMDDNYGLSGSEDCLYLNVFTPNVKGSSPVIVFDYNDNFRTGFNSTDTYSPDFFIEENLVVVHINHRLGVLGYLTTEDDVIPANAGIKDFIMGLKWIRDNISRLGGDPKRVTLMGSRGGSVLIDILLRTEKAKNLFSSAILQSGTALESVFFHKNPREKAFRLGEALNIKTNDSLRLLEDLQQLNVSVLYDKETLVLDRDQVDKIQMSIQPFAPTVELDTSDAIVTSLPEDSKYFNDVPVIIGMNSREGLDLASHFIMEPRLLKDISYDLLFLLPIRTNFRFDRNSDVHKEAAKEILDFYFEKGYFYYENILEYVVYSGDMVQQYALNKDAKQLSRGLESPVYYYLFDFRGSINENSNFIASRSRFSIEHWGATVADELCYLHLCNRIRNNYIELSKLVSDQPEFKVLRKMVRLWANFARTRDPTPSSGDDVLGDFKWRPIVKENNETNYLHITKSLNIKTNPLGEREKFWDRFIAKYSSLAVDGLVLKKESRDEL
ncbi:carboxyl/choline esterase CCE021b [Danaus plexippus plexippus]|uniref:Carboxyl/choline esterase CCE021b n=1 Tax=Danaus plexippus plexippus TaxID=278856 RepID=A0A212FG61_DANPL|nr:carboxyl/choline esterase CCE021b [Danaus plexippus plexippus]